MSKVQYRVVWKRRDLSRRSRSYESQPPAERLLAILAGTPDEAFAAMGIVNPDEEHCCSGRECGCGGQTHREHDAEYRRELPALEYARIEVRDVSEWREAT